MVGCRGAKSRRRSGLGERGGERVLGGEEEVGLGGGKSERDRREIMKGEGLLKSHCQKNVSTEV